MFIHHLSKKNLNFIDAIVIEVDISKQIHCRLDV